MKTNKTYGINIDIRVNCKKLDEVDSFKSHSSHQGSKADVLFIIAQTIVALAKKKPSGATRMPCCVGTLVHQQNLDIRCKHSRNYGLLKRDVQETASASDTKTTFPMESSSKPSGPMPTRYPR